MTDTQLSPRLRHLLLAEDRSTGKLSLPRDRFLASRSTSLSPPESPLDTGRPVSASHSPDYRAHQLPQLPQLPSFREARHLPLPIDRTSRKPSNSVVSLLNDMAVGSPPSTASSDSSRPTLQQQQKQHVYAAPRTAEYNSAPQTPVTPYGYMEQQPYYAAMPAGLMPQRPDFYRRHSSQTYPETRIHTYPGGSIEFTPIFGARPPISRTTKACNACRSRKVRCDAGGNPGGEPGPCSRCRESGVSCVYSGPQKKRGPCPGTLRAPSTTSTNMRRRASCQNLSGAPSHQATPYDRPPLSPSAHSHAMHYSATGPFPPQPHGGQYPHPDYAYGRRGSHLTARSSSSSGEPITPQAYPTGSPEEAVTVLSWPEMEPALQQYESKLDLPKRGASLRISPPPHVIGLGHPRGPMTAPISMEGRTSYFSDRTLPPLRVAIGDRPSFSP